MGPTMRTRSDLQAIARQVMRERGLEPDFSPAVLAEVGALTTAAVERDPAIRDLRDRLWCSIDNDDSRDLDQLSVAEPLAAGQVTILVAVPGLDAQLRLQDRVAQSMKASRHQHGALSLETLETHAVFDDEVLIDLRPDEKNRAKELIEDFMIAANGVTARYLARRRSPSLRRVLKAPERWSRIGELARELGEGLPTTPDARALE